MDEAIKHGITSLIATGPVAFVMLLAVLWLLKQLDKAWKDRDAALSQVKEQHLTIVQAKDQFTIELLKAKDSNNQEKMALYERVMKLLNSLDREGKDNES